MDREIEMRARVEVIHAASELQSIYDVLHCIYDTCEDEGDRIYFGSTNDRWTLQRQLRRLEKLLSPTPKGTPK
jgi:hypothetical protein